MACSSFSAVVWSMVFLPLRMFLRVRCLIPDRCFRSFMLRWFSSIMACRSELGEVVLVVVVLVMVFFFRLFFFVYALSIALVVVLSISVLCLGVVCCF